MKRKMNHVWNRQNQTCLYHEPHVHHYYYVHHMELVSPASVLV